MADAKPVKKVTYPVVPTAHWWALRRKFKQSIPGVVTANYIASVLAMQEASARANVLGGLRLTGIIDQEGKSTDRAVRWRDDLQYSHVCDEIRKECYPQELLDAFQDPKNERQGVARWFANHTGGGEGAVEKFVKFYLLLSEADPSKGAADQKTSERTKASRPQAASAGRGAGRSSPAPRAAAAIVGAPSVSGGVPPTPEAIRTPASPQRDAHTSNNGAGGPAVHINLQVHISADASTDQIDQVFASMAKHIYSKKAAE